MGGRGCECMRVSESVREMSVVRVKDVCMWVGGWVTGE